MTMIDDDEFLMSIQVSWFPWMGDIVYKSDCKYIRSAERGIMAYSVECLSITLLRTISILGQENMLNHLLQKEKTSGWLGSNTVLTRNKYPKLELHRKAYYDYLGKFQVSFQRFAYSLIAILFSQTFIGFSSDFSCNSLSH